jgi:predicted RNA binding protein YcfA (HicA-like mRNA interferase family)
MASSIPVLSGREVVRAFESLGWQVARRRASHIVLVKQGEIATLSVLDHKEVARGTLRSLVRTANLAMQEFVDATKGI